MDISELFQDLNKFNYIRETWDDNKSKEFEDKYINEMEYLTRKLEETLEDIKDFSLEVTKALEEILER